MGVEFIFLPLLNFSQSESNYIVIPKNKLQVLQYKPNMNEMYFSLQQTHQLLSGTKLISIE